MAARQSTGGYQGFNADSGTWAAISSAGDVLTGDTPGALNPGDPGRLGGEAAR
jgi:hypothetical protein